MWRLLTEAKSVQSRRCLPNANLEALVDADLDTLATALYVTTDDLLKANPGRVPLRPRVGIVPKISDAEVLTLAWATQDSDAEALALLTQMVGQRAKWLLMRSTASDGTRPKVTPSYPRR